jgi:hypothetical protein
MSLVASGKVQEAYDRHVSGNFRHHNPYLRGDAQSLRTAMADRVAVFSCIRQNASDRGGAAVHIFRFEGGRIAELWDIGQAVPADNVNENGMF